MNSSDQYKSLVAGRWSLNLAALVAAFWQLAVWAQNQPPTGGTSEGKAPGWSAEFKLTPEMDKDKAKLPEGWELKTKPFTSAAVFSVKKDASSDVCFMSMEADKASGSVICKPDKLNIKDFPVISWSWRASVLPAGGDARDFAKDDQAIGIYVGTGSMFDKKSISYHWDTDTPKGAEGECKYGGGTISVKWFTLRNKEDVPDDGKPSQWFTEERNFLEDFKKAWGFVPESVYVSVSCNSQYTGTKAAADLQWIRFTAVKGDR